jgi:AraC-like DNA-binding protein
MPGKGREIRITAENLEEYSDGLAAFFGHTQKKIESVRSAVSGPLFNGAFEVHRIGDDLNLYAVDLQVCEDTALYVDVERRLTGFAILLSGNSRHVMFPKNGEKETSFDFRPGHNVIGMYHAEKARFELKGGEVHRLVEVQIDASALPSFFEDAQESAPDVLRPFLEKSPDKGLVLKNTLSPSLECAANQVINCPLQGKARELFMQGKALEIMAHQLEALSASTVPGTRRVAEDDVERLLQARRILDVEFADPPSLTELSHRIGMNDFKLKRGFRQVFGTTVFGYVRRLRMDKARAMLESGSFSVTEAALMSGYSCLGYFSAAFKRRFGILPRDFRKRSVVSARQIDQAGELHRKQFSGF